MILYYIYGWNPFKSKEDFQIDICEQIKISNHKHLKETREKIVEDWYLSFQEENIGLRKEYCEEFYVFDQKGNEIDQFSIRLKTGYEIYDGKEEE